MHSITKICIISLLMSLPAFGGEPNQLPAEEIAFKNDVDHWGLAFSDQLDVFKENFQIFAKKTGIKSPDYVVGIESPLRKTFKNKYWFKGQVTNEVTLSAGRNETEAFQLAIIPQTGCSLADIKILVSDLKTTDGKNVIPADCITLYRVGFIETAKPQYPTRHIGEWPDPLFQLTPFSLTGVDLGLIWYEVKVPLTASGGDYDGTITVSPAKLNSIEIKVKLHVWKFALPDRVPFSTKVWINGDMDSKEYLDICRLFLEHYVDPISVGKTTNLDLLDKNLEFCFSRGLMCFQAPDFTTPEDLRPYYEHLKKKGWLDKAIIYSGFDEPTAKVLQENIIPRTALIHKQFPGLKVFQASQYYENLDKGTDIWMTDVSTNFQSWLAAGRPGKQQLWWYFCHLPIHVNLEQPLVDAPNMLIDNDAVEHRLAYWMANCYGAQGIFIYAGNMEWDKISSKGTQECAKLSDAKLGFPYAGTHNGNGFLIYPGPRPSLRLKVLRDGIEDYWYLAQLKELTLKKRYASEARALLDGISPKIFVDTHYFNRDPNVILVYREKIGELLEKAAVDQKATAKK